MSTASDHQQLPQQGDDEQARPGLKRQVKKQTRRRVHTSRPYQESLVNLAEARREVVNALRIHRANMRQQEKKQRQRQARVLLQQQPEVQVMMFQEQQSHQQAFEGAPPLPVATTSCAFSSYATAAGNSNHSCSSPLIAHLVPAGNNYHWSSSMLPYDLPPLKEEAPPAAIAGDLEQLFGNLPAQPLGLNLSFQGFGDDPSFGAPWIQPPPPCPAAAAYSCPVTTTAGRHGYTSYSSSVDAPAELMSRVLDGEVEMPYSVCGRGETQQGAELTSEAAANVAAASAWWTKILESMAESGGEGAAEVCKAHDDVVAAEAWQLWLCDGAEPEVAAPGPEPDVLETNTTHVVDDGGGIALPQCVDTEGWDDAEWFS